MNGGQEVADLCSQRMADEMYPRQSERVAEREQVIDVIGDAVAMRRLVALAPPAQVRRDGIPALFGQGWPKLRPFLVAEAEAMHEHHSPLWPGELAQVT